MALIQVTFEYITGLRRPLFRNARLTGSWNGAGRYDAAWSTVEMEAFTAEDGCPGFRATIGLDDSQLGWAFQWGVVADTLQRTNAWIIATEVDDPASSAQHRNFRLQGSGQVERYWLTHCRRLGANKLTSPAASAAVAQFSVWAPHAKEVATVIGDATTGYIWPDGKGAGASFAMAKDEEGIWRTNPADPALADFAAWDHKPYMYRIVTESGAVRYRTDLFSRCQIGSGTKDPEKAPWNGTPTDLNGTKSCSVVVDPERVTALFDEPFPQTQWLSDQEFWRDEFDPLRPLPTRTDDLVIYEMHVGGLGFGSDRPGTLKDALNLLDHLSDLGVNAIELLPMSEAEGWSWGYGSSHHFAIEFAGGGRDQMKFFIRECHRRGIAVLVDVVYNHFVADGERSEWAYDSDTPEHNGYYWYQGAARDYPQPDGGYCDNGSTGYCPNFRTDMVRKLLVSSAAMLMTEFHIDGFRVDLTQAIHRDNVLHANGYSCGDANAFGAKFLREWVRTLRLIKPQVMLVAEDHSGWDAITLPQSAGGLGFDGIWWVEWYHHLIGDSQANPANARLLHVAGFGGNEPLAMSYLAGALEATPRRVVYHESHDQAGNADYQEGGQRQVSARTIRVAVNDQLDANRFWAEARCRVAAALTLLSGGVPMFFMGEEVGAQQPYRYNDFLAHREDIAGLRQGSGAQLFRFYQDVIRLRRSEDAFRAPNVAVAHVHDANRVIAFRRWRADSQFLVIASLNNAAFDQGYWVPLGGAGDGQWNEVLNSDASLYGGRNLGNPGRLTSSNGFLNVRVPAAGIIVLQRL